MSKARWAMLARPPRPPVGPRPLKFSPSLPRGSARGRHLAPPPSPRCGSGGRLRGDMPFPLPRGEHARSPQDCRSGSLGPVACCPWVAPASTGDLLCFPMDTGIPPHPCLPWADKLGVSRPRSDTRGRPGCATPTEMPLPQLSAMPTWAATGGHCGSVTAPDPAPTPPPPHITLEAADTPRPGPPRGGGPPPHQGSRAEPVSHRSRSRRPTTPHHADLTSGRCTARGARRGTRGPIAAAGMASDGVRRNGPRILDSYDPTPDRAEVVRVSSLCETEAEGGGSPILESGNGETARTLSRTRENRQMAPPAVTSAAFPSGMPGRGRWRRRRRGRGRGQGGRGRWRSRRP